MPPSINYMNRSAPFWDWVASLEQDGASHPFFAQNQDSNSAERGSGEHHEHAGPRQDGFEPWSWAFQNFGGGRAFPHRGPPPPPGPPPFHNEAREHEDEKHEYEDVGRECGEEKGREQDGENDNGEGPSGSGSDGEGGRPGWERRGRCGSRRGRGCGRGGFGRHDGPHHGGPPGPHHGPPHHGGPPGPHHGPPHHGGPPGPHHGPPHHGPPHHGPPHHDGPPHGGEGRHRGPPPGPWGRRGRWGGWGGWGSRGAPFGGRSGHDDPFNPLAMLAGLFDPTANNTTPNNEDFTPDTDIFDTPSAYILHVSLPGAKKEDVGVNWDADKSELSIAGVVYRPGDEEFLKTLAVDERKVGPFEKKVRLGTRASPANVDVDGIVAKLEDGILRVEVPKLEDSGFVEVRKVDVE